MDPTEIIAKLPTTAQGWLGWAVAAVVTAVIYFPKAWSERRGENKEIERLEKALADERSLRKEGDAENRQLIADNRLLNEKINDLVQKFSNQNATNARLEEQMKHLAEQNDELRKQVSQLQESISKGSRT